MRFVFVVGFGIASLGCGQPDSGSPSGSGGSPIDSGGPSNGGATGSGDGGKTGSGGAAAPTGTGGAPGSGGTTPTGAGGGTGTGGNSVGSGGIAATGGMGSGGTPSTGTGGSRADAGTTPGDGGARGGMGGGATGGLGGAAGSASAGGGGRAGNDYNPCPPAGTACLIMPLGDSITQGKSGSSDQGGYRETLWRLANKAGKSFKLVGSQSNGPTTVDGVAWTRTHEGYSGYTIDYTAANSAGGRNNGALTRNMLTPNNIKTYKPHIVLLMIGTNDLSIGEDMPSVRLANLVDTILNTDPNLLLFLTQITPGLKSNPDTYNSQVATYNLAIAKIVSDRAAAGKHIRLMDMNTPFTSVANYSTMLLAGGVHPNDAGYKLMGEVWYATLAPLIH